MTTRKRADRALIERGLAPSRARAQAAIEAGLVSADGVRVEKASQTVAPEAELRATPTHPYVSRGGLKLQAALDRFAIDPRGKVCLDVGERTDARALDRKLVPEPVDLVVADVSFISLELVLPAALALTASSAELVALVKPQFEAGRAHLKKGIVRDEAVQKAVCADIERFIAVEGWRIIGSMQSPIAGGEGNREFLIGAPHG